MKTRKFVITVEVEIEIEATADAIADCEEAKNQAIEYAGELGKWTCVELEPETPGSAGELA